MREYGIPVTNPVDVVADITGPSGVVETVPLASSGDGSYGVTLGDNVLPGAYTVRVKARGATLKGNPVEREKTLTGVILKEKQGFCSCAPVLSGIKDTLDMLNRCCLAIGVLLLILLLTIFFG